MPTMNLTPSASGSKGGRLLHLPDRQTGVRLIGSRRIILNGVAGTITSSSPALMVVQTIQSSADAW
jgi:hypothetical protein